MDLNAELKKIPQPNPKAAAFYQRAAAFIEQAKISGRTSLAAVQRDSDEFRAWEEYFRATGWEPEAFKMARSKGLQSVTMATQWPQWFDTDFAVSDRRAAPVRPQARPIDRAAIERIEARAGKNWGLAVASKRGGLKPLPEERITRLAGRRPVPLLPDAPLHGAEADDPLARLERLRDTPVGVSAELSARYTRSYDEVA